MSTTTVTSTIFLPQSFSTGSSSIMIPSSSTTSDSSNRIVRFDSECVLIPDRSKQAKMLSKSYSLPLWKKKSSYLSDSDTETTSTSPGTTNTPQETHIVLKVPIPRFISKSSRSPTRGRSTSTSPTTQPLSPCLVYRSPSSSPSTPHRTIRTASLPITTQPRRKDDTALTIPLRACCPECASVTEECLKEGEKWQEKFSRGARRRRSASLDDSNSFLSRGSLTPSTSMRHVRGFTAVTTNPSAPAVIISCANPRYDKSSNFSITVDEVDKRRKSLEFSDDEMKQLQQTHVSSPSSPPSSYQLNTFSPTPHPLSPGLREKDTLTPSLELTVSDFSPRLKSSPIQEEDEDQLFPLPSPRRSPNNSPSPSLNPSPSISPAPSTKASPAPSPHASTSCLSPPDDLVASKNNVPASSGSEEDILAESLSRKPTRPNTEPYHTLHALGPLSPSSDKQNTDLSQHIQGTSSSNLDTNTNIVSLGNTTKPKKPKLSPLVVPTPALTSSVPSQRSPRPNDEEPGTRKPRSLPPIPLSTPQRSSLTPNVPTPPPSSFPTKMGSPPAKSPSRSPVTPQRQPRRPSFSLPFIRDALKGAGADVLKGVSSMGVGGVAGSV